MRFRFVDVAWIALVVYMMSGAQPLDFLDRCGLTLNVP